MTVIAGTARDAEILARVRAIPEGFVRTYGDISPGARRLAGSVLHGCDDPTVPWHRIVRAAAHWPRAIASAGCCTARVSRSRARGSTCGSRG